MIGAKQLTSTERFSPENIGKSLAAGKPVDMAVLTPELRLIAINSFLTRENLRTLPALGDKGRGQVEFVGIERYQPDKFVSRIDFKAEVIGADGKVSSFNHLVLINSNTNLVSSAIIVPVISVEGSDVPHVLLVKQFRPVIGKTTFELPRGFVDPQDPRQSRAIAVALRELREECGVRIASIKSFRGIGSIHENTGTSNTATNIMVAEIELSRKEFETHQQMIRREDSGGVITTHIVPLTDAPSILEDQHSLAALIKSNVLVFKR